MLAQAEEDDWHQYEAAANQLIEQLGAALNQRDAIKGVTNRRPTSATGRVGPHSPGANRGRVLGGAPGAPGAPSGATPASSHHLMRALSLMEDNLAAAIDPDQLTGLSLRSYDGPLLDLMSRLVVQSVAQLRQRVMEDRALEQQLRQIAWAATFTSGPPSLPSGALPPREAAAYQAATKATAPHT
ncbi:uncharacterized protein HaLaN_26997, partial [Haematococcus lacustris]